MSETINSLPDRFQRELEIRTEIQRLTEELSALNQADDQEILDAMQPDIGMDAITSLQQIRILREIQSGAVQRAFLEGETSQLRKQVLELQKK